MVFSSSFLSFGIVDIDGSRLGFEFFLGLELRELFISLSSDCVLSFVKLELFGLVYGLDEVAFSGCELFDVVTV